MKSPHASGRGFSVRGFSNAAIATLAVLALAVVIGLLWTSALLQQNSVTLVRETQSMDRASQIELQLLAYQRMANVALFTEEQSAFEARDRVEQEVRALLEDPELFLSSEAESELVKQAIRDTESYLKERRSLEERDLSPWQVIYGSQARLDEAVEGLEGLRDLNANQVRQAYNQAQDVGALFTAVSITAGVVILGLLVLFAAAVRRLFLRPILTIRAALERFREGDRSARAPPEGPSELREIASAFNDMSARIARQREEQLAFLAGVAHDLKNPLQGIKMGVQVLELDGVSGERRERTLAMLHRQLEHLTRMVGDFLDASRVEAGELDLEMVELDLREVVGAVVHLYAPVSEDHEVSSEVPSSPILVRGDRVRMEQILGNLVSNAIKYSPEGGPVKVAVATEDDQAVVSVSDQGIGIPAEEIEEVFQPFRRPSAAGVAVAGSGLGLSVVRRLVTALEGRIEVDSMPGAGSTFRVRFPLAQRAHRTPEEKVGQERRLGG